MLVLPLACCRVLLLLLCIIIGFISRCIHAHSPPSVMIKISTTWSTHQVKLIGKWWDTFQTKIKWKKWNVNTKSRICLARWTMSTRRGILAHALTIQTMSTVQPKPVSARISVSTKMRSRDNSVPVSMVAAKRMMLRMMYISDCNAAIYIHLYEQKRFLCSLFCFVSYLSYYKYRIPAWGSKWRHCHGTSQVRDFEKRTALSIKDTF